MSKCHKPNIIDIWFLLWRFNAINALIWWGFSIKLSIVFTNTSFIAISCVINNFRSFLFRVLLLLCFKDSNEIQRIMFQSRNYNFFNQCLNILSGRWSPLKFKQESAYFDHDRCNSFKCEKKSWESEKRQLIHKMRLHIIKSWFDVMWFSVAWRGVL